MLIFYPFVLFRNKKSRVSPALATFVKLLRDAQRLLQPGFKIFT